jgi:hypothetical protein
MGSLGEAWEQAGTGVRSEKDLHPSRAGVYLYFSTVTSAFAEALIGSFPIGAPFIALSDCDFWLVLRVFLGPNEIAQRKVEK